MANKAKTTQSEPPAPDPEPPEMVEPPYADDKPLEERSHTDLLALARRMKIKLPGGHVAKAELIRLLREG